MQEPMFTLPSTFLRKFPERVQKELLALSPKAQYDFWFRYNRQRKSTPLAYLLWAIFGLHYAYLNQWLVQFLFWITAGGLGVWWLIDLFRMPGLVKRHNYAVATQVLAMIHFKPYS